MNSSVISWKCTKYKLYGCYARAVTKLVEGREYVKLSKPDHTHPPESFVWKISFLIKITKLRNRIDKLSHV